MSVFIHCSPAGWDNEKKISILYENMSGMKPDDPFEDVIVRPVTRKVSYDLWWVNENRINCQCVFVCVLETDRVTT